MKMQIKCLNCIRKDKQIETLKAEIDRLNLVVKFSQAELKSVQVELNGDTKIEPTEAEWEFFRRQSKNDEVCKLGTEISMPV